MNFFLGAQNGVFWVGGQKVYVEKVYVLLPSLRGDDLCECACVTGRGGVQTF